MNVLITGASAGFGLACARLFAEHGHSLILLARRSERLAKLKEELGLDRVQTIVADIQDKDQLETGFKSLPKKFEEVDVLINNAGLALGLGPTHQAELSDWETMIKTNILGLTYCTRLILPGMVSRNRGHVINIGSVAARAPYPGGNVYGGTKAFVNQFSRNLRCDLFGTAIRVTNIEPGLAETEFSLVRFKGDVERAAKPYQNTEPLTAQDIAQAVYWVTTLPAHVNIDNLEIMPTGQSSAGMRLVENKV